MVRRLLELPGAPSPDAADALACAIATPMARWLRRTARAGYRVRRGAVYAVDARRPAASFRTAPQRSARDGRRGHLRHGRPDARHRAARRARLERARRARWASTSTRALAPRMIGRNFADCARDAPRALRRADYPVDDAARARWHAAYDAIVARDGLALKPGPARAAGLARWRARFHRRRDVDAPRARARQARAQRACMPRFARAGRRRRGGARQAGAGHLSRGGAQARRRRRRPASCSRIRSPAMRAALAAGMMADHGARSASAVAELAALAVERCVAARVCAARRRHERARGRPALRGATRDMRDAQLRTRPCPEHRSDRIAPHDRPPRRACWSRRIRRRSCSTCRASPTRSTCR